MVANCKRYFRDLRSLWSKASLSMVPFIFFPSLNLSTNDADKVFEGNGNSPLCLANGSNKLFRAAYLLLHKKLLEDASQQPVFKAFRRRRKRAALFSRFLWKKKLTLRRWQASESRDRLERPCRYVDWKKPWSIPASLYPASPARIHFSDLSLE